MTSETGPRAAAASGDESRPGSDDQAADGSVDGSEGVEPEGTAGPEPTEIVDLRVVTSASSDPGAADESVGVVEDPDPDPDPARRLDDLDQPAWLHGADTVPTAPAAAELPPRPAALARRVMLVVAPLLVVVVLTSSIVAGLIVRADARDDDAERWRAVATDQDLTRDRVERLWSGVLGLVAAGIGQRVVESAQVSSELGAVQAASTEEGPDGSAAPELDAGRVATGRFVARVGEVLSRSGDDPLDLGNELAALDAAHSDAVRTLDASVERLEALADDAASDAERSRLVSLIALAAGLVASIAVWLVARRALRGGLDRPVDSLNLSVAALARGEAPQGPPVRGFADLAELSVALDRSVSSLAERVAGLRLRTEWGERSRRIFEALDLAEDEDAAHEVIQRALGIVDPKRSVELLVAERGTTRLRVVASNPGAPPPACPVDATNSCVALRRGQVSVFDSSETINACPKLRNRPGGECSAVCVPVTVATRPVGVLHMTGPPGRPPARQVTEQLVDLATQIGTRFAALRTLETSRQEASTDKLTGLPNRRTLESEVAQLVDSGTPFIMVLADLDKFKRLNDTYGHEVGDRALQLFAGVLRDNVRGNDVVARLGGEEFVLVYPNMTVEISLEAIGRLRQALARSVEASHVPDFTCSFGITHSSVASDGDAILRVADAGLLQAKELGGDQAVVADGDLAADVFSGSRVHPRSDPEDGR